MKILIEHPAYVDVNGALVQTRNLMAGLEALGAEVHLLIGTGRGDREPPWRHVGAWKGMFDRSVRLNLPDVPDAFEEACVNLLSTLNVDVLVVNGTPQVMKATRLMKRPPICVVIAHNQWVELWAEVMLNIPGVCPYVVCVSEDVRKRLRAISGISTSGIRTILNGADPDSVVDRDGSRGKRLRERLGLSDSDFVVGFVGRLSPGKKLDTLFEALGKMDDTGVKLMLAGGGKYYSKIRMKAHKAGVLSRVIFAGFRPDMRDAYSAMDAIALASASEGLPMAIIEGMFCLKPIVVRPVGGITEILRDGYSAFFAETPGEFAAALSKLRRKRKLGRYLAENAREFAMRHLTHMKMARQYFGLFCCALLERMHQEKSKGLRENTTQEFDGEPASPGKVGQVSTAIAQRLGQMIFARSTTGGNER